MKFEVGIRIGDYRLLSRCGEGAYGVVFLAENVITGRRVALKAVAAAGRNCERELKGLRQYQQICRGTGLLQIYHVGAGEDFFYYTMDAADPLDDGEYTPKTLANILKAEGKLPAAAVRTMADELIFALEILHKKGMMHRDIKPENILWVEDQAVPGDIGLITDGGGTTLAGTPGFMPPEVLAGLREYEEKDDFYALGKVLYCALTGLPVTQYPSFPASSTLTGAGEIIKLYNRLCAGGPVRLPRRRGSAGKILASVGLACLLVIAFLAGRYRGKAAEAASRTVSAPPSRTVRVEKQETHPAQDRPASAELESAYTPSPEMLELLPKLQEHFSKLEMAMYTAIGKGQNVSDAELAKAEKYLAQHPGHPLTGQPQLLVIEARQQQVEQDFERKYRDDPVWRYFRNRQELAICLAHIHGHILKPVYSLAEARAKLRDLSRRQRILEAAILKKYRK